MDTARAHDLADFVENDDTADLFRSIRCVTRGLDVIRQLNTHNGASVSEVAKAVKLPRTTTYRVLETLREAGFVSRGPADDFYRLTIQVRTLSGGYDDEAWLHTIGRPAIAKLGREARWPVTITTPCGTSMLVRETTDLESPLALRRYPAGFRAPLLGSSSGRLYLALCTPQQRATILDVLASSHEPQDKLARDKALVARVLTEIQAAGFAICDTNGQAELNLAVPVITHNAMRAALVMRFIRSAVTPDQAIKKYLPAMKETAAEIGKAIAARNVRALHTARDADQNDA